jgi:Kef-type K+ transport system membrane component KefB
MEEIVEVLWVGLLLFCLWFFGALAEEINCPALIAEIVVGCVLGPEILDVVPEVEG